MPPRPQLKWNLFNDNSILSQAPNQQQINSIYTFCHHFNHAQYQFVGLSHRIAPAAALSTLQIVEDQLSYHNILKEIEQQRYLFLDTISDFSSSYKGFISYVIVGFNTRGYLIDAFALRKEVRKIKNIVQNPSITKFCFRLTVVLEDIKRDWGAFGCNFFDFELLQKSIGLNRQPNLAIARAGERPIITGLLQQLQDRYETMVKYVAQIRYFLDQDQTKEHSIYAYSNHYELLLKEYRHKATTFEDQGKEYYLLRNEARMRFKEDKQNYTQNYIEKTTEDDELIICTNRQKYMCELLLHWRQHIAKLSDLPSRKILNYQQILTIAIQRPTSILQLQKIIGNTVDSLEVTPKILELLALESELNQDSENQLQVKSNKRKQDRNIKSLLSQLKWQGRQEWVNRKNDESIKLYKEIVSIVELDGSVIEEFTDGMNNGVVSTAQIGRFVKYAEFLRNGNHKKLKQFYDSCLPIESGYYRQAELQGWESQDQDSFISGEKTSKSQTSIAGSSQKIAEKAELQTFHTLPTIKSPTSFTSLLEYESKIEPLPQNIEEIYLKAASVKKSYQKIQKKKGGRKQGKQQAQQFVPSWQQIKLLLQA